MYKWHPKDYDDTVMQNGWTYPLSTQTKHSSAGDNPHDVDTRVLPQFSLEAFMDSLIHFVVADDQVSCSDFYSYHALTCPKSIRVIECPEFRNICLILCETLIDRDIPHCDKLRESIIKCCTSHSTL
jgi:hypothetical protein